MTAGPMDGTDDVITRAIPRSARFRPGGDGLPPPLPVPAVPLAPAAPPQLRFTPAADARGTDRDVILAYQLFLGRDPENSFVIANARTSPVHAMIQGFITSEEFTSAVLAPLEAGRPLPHEHASGGPEPGQREFLLRNMMLDAIGQAAIRDAVTWRDFLRVLVGLPGFPRTDGPQARPDAAEAGDESPGFILITIDKPRAGDVLQGSRLEGSGWVIAPSDVLEVSVHLGDAMLGQARFGLPRPDVARRFPHYRQVGRCGFAFSVDVPGAEAVLPVADGGDDVALLTIMVRTANGELGRKGVRLRPAGAPQSAPPKAERKLPAALRDASGAYAAPVALQIDAPAAEGDAAPIHRHEALVVSGWAVAQAGVLSVRLSAGEQPLGAAHLGTRREDIASAYADYPASLLSSWTLVVPPGSLPPGTHRLCAVAEGADGTQAECAVSIVVEGDAPSPPDPRVRRTMPQAEAAFGMRLLARQAVRPHFTVLVDGDGQADAAGLRDTLASLNGQVMTDWHAEVALADGTMSCVGVPFVPASGRQELMLRLRAGDTLGCDALLELAVALAIDPDADFVYADDMRVNRSAGGLQPRYKPDFAPEMLLGMNYVGRAWCARASLAAAAGLRPAALCAASDYDAALRLTELATHIVHVPNLLLQAGPSADTPAQEAAALAACLHRRGVEGEVCEGPAPGLWRIRRALSETACVSIIMPTCGARGLVRRAINSVRDTLASAPAAPAVEIVVIDDVPAKDRRLRNWLRKHADVVVPAPGPFNWSRYNNQGAAASRGEVLLFLNDDIEMTEPGWLAPMLEQVQRQETGVVGARLLYPDGRVQHAGLYLAEGHGRHAFRFAEGADLGPFGIAGVVREVTAVTGACMMVRRAVFTALGGFDEAHGVVNNDVDFCLRARRAGLGVLYTPHATLLHHELASRAELADSCDEQRFKAAFGLDFARGDPFRNPALLAHGDHFTADPETATLIIAGRRGPAPESVKRILAIKLDHIGDFLTSVPALRFLKKRFPQAHITLLAAAPTAALAGLEPAVDAVEPFAFFHERSEEGELALSKADLAGLHARLAPRAFDLAVDLRMHPDTREVLRHTGAAFLAGYDHDGRFPWLDVSLEWEGDRPLAGKRAHVSERLLQLVEAVAAACSHAAAPSGAIDDAAPVLALLPEAFAGLKLVCVHPGVGNPVRQWPASSYAALIGLLAEAGGVGIVLVGSADEAAIAGEVMRLAAPGTPVCSLAGQVPLSSLPALLRSCVLFVGNNSGPGHVAARLGVPTVSVHSGVVDAREWAPLGLASVAVQRRMRCGPCYIASAGECPRNLACLTELRPRDVLAACRRLLASGGPDAWAEDEAETGRTDQEDNAPTPGPKPSKHAGGLLEEAEAMARAPLQAAAEGVQGYIETLASDGAGAVWVVGWMKRGFPLDFAAVVSDRQTYSAIVSIMTYTRADLPADAYGIVGILSGNWRPALAGARAPEDFALFFGPGGRFHLRCHKPLRVIGTQDFAGEYQALVQRGLALQQSPNLVRVLGSIESWQPTPPGGAWLGTETSVDRVLLVPGMGCFMEGWVLSPLRRVESLRLRVGGVVMALQPHTLTWKPRPDLVDAYPASEAMASRAGFVGLFESDQEPGDYAEPLLKIVFEGGASVNWRVPPKVFRKLGQSARLEDARSFFPALEEEPFFPAFAHAAARAGRALIVPAVPVQVAAAPAALVFVLPRERCDMFLVFESVARHCRMGGSPPGVVFLAPAGDGRSDAMWLFREFVRDLPGTAGSLMTIGEPAHGLTLLADILAMVGASRFAFIADGVFLTEAGWEEVRTRLATDPVAPVFFAAASGELGARCFAWSTALLARWSAGAVAFLGGFHGDNGIGRDAQAVRVPGAAWSSRTPVRSGLHVSVNRVLAGEVA